MRIHGNNTCKKRGDGKLYHVLHADADFSITVESSVKTHNVGGVTLVKHLQLSDDLVPDGRLDLQVNQL